MNGSTFCVSVCCKDLVVPATHINHTDANQLTYRHTPPCTDEQNNKHGHTHTCTHPVLLLLLYVLLRCDGR
jgi:hypothetical protein